MRRRTSDTTGSTADARQPATVDRDTDLGLSLTPPHRRVSEVDAAVQSAVGEALRAAFEQSPVSTVVYDATGRPVAINPAFARLWETTLEAVPANYTVLTDPQLEAAGALPLIRRAFGLDGEPAQPVTIPPLRYDVRTVTGQGRTRWTEAYAYPVHDAAGTLVQVVLTHQDVTARIEAEGALVAARAEAERRAEVAAALADQLQRQAVELEERVEQSRALTRELEATNDELRRAAEALAERARHAALGAEVAAAVAERGPLDAVLRRCCAAVVEHLGAAFARVWTLEELGAGAAPTLVLQASAGLYTNTEGRHARIPVGALKIGRIAAERRPHLTNDVPNDPAVSDREWARREGMVAFAGYPLVVDDRLIGVLALFARQTLDEGTLDALRAVADRVALAIQRHADDAALRRAEERVRLALESANVGYWDLDLASGVLTWDERCRAVFGLDRDAPVDYDVFYHGLHPEDREATHQVVQAALDPAGSGVYDVEYRTMWPDGTVRWAVAKGQALFQGTGASRRAVRFIGTILDITARKEAEEERARLLAAEHAARVAAEQAGERTRRLQEAIAALNTVTSAEGAAAVIVEQGIRATGATAAAVAIVRPDLTALDTLHSAGYAAEVAARYRTMPLAPGRPLSDVVLTGRPAFFESAERAAERYPGEVVDDYRAAGIEAYVAVPIVTSGRVSAVLSLSYEAPRAFAEEDRGLTLALAEQCGQALERVRLYDAEREARRTAERLQALTAALSGAATQAAVGGVVLEHGVRALGAHAGVVALTTPDGEALEIAASTGYPPEACMGPGRRWPVTAPMPIADAARTDEPALVGSIEEWAARYPDAHVPPRRGNAAWAAFPVLDGTRRGALLWTFDDRREFGGDEVALMATIARLCSQALERARLFESEQAARAAAEGANQAKSDFLGTMSHELRTPLNAIAGYVDLLDLELRGPVTAAQRQDLGRIRRSAQVLMALVNDILNFARLDAGQVEFHLGDVRLDLALADLDALIAPQVRARGLTYGYDAGGEALLVRADPERLKQVLLNLLSNAVKFTEPGGRIALTCDAADGLVRIRVTDTGRGIPAEQLDRVFEPFVQIDRHLTQSSQQGVGLGLAISRDLARRMGGDLVAESTVGAGSTFTLVLPRGSSSEY
jgi:PAS domain S-box-containing protein